MPVSIKEKIAETREIFRQLVWPLWRQTLSADELISTEGSEQPFERRADSGGIDAYFARSQSGVLIPLASRIEYAWADDVEVSRRLDPRFTIRSEKRNGHAWHDNSELKRLLDASADRVARRYLPYRTFQTLVSKDHREVLFTSSICTRKLCDHARHKITLGSDERTTTRDGDARFLEIKVKELVAAGVEVETIYPISN